MAYLELNLLRKIPVSGLNIYFVSHCNNILGHCSVESASKQTVITGSGTNHYACASVNLALIGGNFCSVP